MSFAKSLTPRIAKRYLLFLAAIVWTFAGSMLLFKGSTFMQATEGSALLKVAIGAIGGVVFYMVMFSKISLKHVTRILNLKPEYPCAFSFFNLKSYIMMGGMISLGIFLRTSGLVPIKYLAVFYITMGIPLFLSAFRFYYYGFKYETVKIKN